MFCIQVIEYKNNTQRLRSQQWKTAENNTEGVNMEPKYMASVGSPTAG